MSRTSRRPMGTTPATPPQGGELSRRSLFKKAGAAAGVGVVALSMGTSYAAAANGETMTVWRLDPDWGYPRGPHGKTRLRSRASLNAAAHRYALTEQDALDMNLHLCSFAPAVPVEVCTAEFMYLWDELAYEWQNPWKDTQVAILDDRCVDHVPNGAEVLARALQGPSAPTAAPGPTPTPPASTASASAPSPALAVTGSSTSTTALAGGAAIIAGAMLRWRSRTVTQPDEEGGAA